MSSTRSSEGGGVPRSEQGGVPGVEAAVRSRPVGWLVAALLVVIAVGCGYRGATQAEGRVLYLTLAAMMAAVAVMLVRGTGRSAHGWRAGVLAGQPVLILPLTGRGSLSSVALVCTVFGLGLGLGALMADSVGLVVVLALIALFMLVVAAELWRIRVRRPELRLSADLVQLRGSGIEAELAWDDVATVDYRDLGTRWGAVALSAATDATTYRARLRRLLLPTDRLPDPPGIVVRVGLVPDAPGLLALCRELHAGGRVFRESRIAHRS